ncbi:MAG: YihY/virulence factor BrkB family protein [Rudanella sp.]|nr:YihY/virulence factor BrkB family protein [Rudanella sp.]
MRKLLQFSDIFRKALSNLKDNDPVRMAGATAFFAFFALPSIIVILNQVLSLLFNYRHQSVSGHLFDQLAGLFGPQSARQLQDISQHLKPKSNGFLLTIANIAVLLLTSTTLFAVLKNSLNQLWNVKTKPDRVVLHNLKDRGIALLIIMGSGLLFTASVVIGQALSLPEPSPRVHVDTIEAFGKNLAQLILSIGLLTAWFAMLLNYLPDIRVRWPAVWVGAFVTSVLFTLGELVLTRLLTYNQIQSIHGGASAITLVLLFVFYSSLIFYYGASFTRQYAEWANLDVVPNDHAISYTITDVDE